MTTPAKQRQLEATCRDVGKLIGSAMPPKAGFALLVFDMSDPSASGDGFMTYISNSQRADMLKALIELVARFRREDLEGFTPADIADVATELALAAGVSNDLESVRQMAACAVALGASPGLARTTADERAAEATRR